MRVATNTIYQNSVYNMQRTTASISDTMIQMSLGKSLQAPSDDPIGATRVMGLEQDNTAANQYIENIKGLSNYYGRAESALSTMTDSMLRITELTTAADSNATTPENRQAYAAELRSIQEMLVDMANSKDGSNGYLFSGNGSDKPPIVKDSSGNYRDESDDGKREVPISGSSSLPANFTGKELFFSSGGDIFNQLSDYIKVLENPKLSPGDNKYDTAQSKMEQMLESSRDQINSAITTIGGNQNGLQMMQSYHQDTVLYNTKVIGETEDLDYAQAMTDYSTNLTVLQATQATYVKIANLSLFNEI